MTTTFRALSVSGVVGLAAAVLAVTNGPIVTAQTDGDGDISGVVTSATGPEAGVWVIAETTDFDVSFRKIVVTDDEGRFLVPDLPDALYRLWVRGYGLADSTKTPARPGDEVGLTATAAFVKAAKVRKSDEVSLASIP